MLRRGISAVRVSALSARGRVSQLGLRLFATSKPSKPHRQPRSRHHRRADSPAGVHASTRASSAPPQSASNPKALSYPSLAEILRFAKRGKLWSLRPSRDGASDHRLSRPSDWTREERTDQMTMVYDSMVARACAAASKEWATFRSPLLATHAVAGALPSHFHNPLSTNLAHRILFTYALWSGLFLRARTDRSLT